MASQCCATGELHTGIPVGSERKVHGLDCYVSEPPKGIPPKGIIVILPDVFGWKLVNTRILADTFAKEGEWIVYLAEFMNGTYAPPHLLTSIHRLSQPGLGKLWHLVKCIYYLIPFRWATRPSVTKPKIINFFKDIRRNEGANLPVGTAGYCWGGKWTTVLASDSEREAGRSLVDATYTAHPSALAIPSDISAIRIPTSIAAAALDERYPKEQVDATEAILKRKTDKDGTPHEVIWYEGNRHGFATRGSETNEVEKEGARRAAEQAIEWFQEIFVGVDATGIRE
ncbi:Alpha/Beta hydrolase protein [Lophiotrema nucula]|uniref:Alpha/Beta hydrolase protein n=1 Tax=Lophiotrema nucula TaxID=690887 RepID=A0A6A5ZTR3_9PLEO|nr:Alpha/Beta hydrolase protein [Lophiotrema nucula]